jgi:hypothetical protein
VTEDHHIKAASVLTIPADAFLMLRIRVRNALLGFHNIVVKPHPAIAQNVAHNKSLFTKNMAMVFRDVKPKHLQCEYAYHCCRCVTPRMLQREICCRITPYTQEISVGSSVTEDQNIAVM